MESPIYPVDEFCAELSDEDLCPCPRERVPDTLFCFFVYSGDTCDKLDSVRQKIARWYPEGLRLFRGGRKKERGRDECDDEYGADDSLYSFKKSLEPNFESIAVSSLLG